MNISEKPHRLKHCETTSIIIILCNNYHLVMTNSLPWKIQPFLRTVNHLFLWAMFHGYVTNNQRVLTYVDGSKPCTPGEHQNSWEMDVHPTKNVSIGIDPSPYDTSLYGYGSRTALPIWMGGWTARALVKSPLCEASLWPVPLWALLGVAKNMGTNGRQKELIEWIYPLVI